jgi:hypothetical protein
MVRRRRAVQHTRVRMGRRRLLRCQRRALPVVPRPVVATIRVHLAQAPRNPRYDQYVTVAGRRRQLLGEHTPADVAMQSKSQRKQRASADSSRRLLADAATTTAASAAAMGELVVDLQSVGRLCGRIRR